MDWTGHSPFEGQENSALTPFFDALNDHVSAHFAELEESVGHKQISSIVHVDLCSTKVIEEFGFRLIYTNGMAALPIPGAPKERERTELIVAVDGRWSFEQLIVDPAHRCLRSEMFAWAKHAHQMESELGYYGLSSPHDQGSFSGTGLAGSMIVPGELLLGRGSSTFELEGCGFIFRTLVFLSPREMEIARTMQRSEIHARIQSLCEDSSDVVVYGRPRSSLF